MKDYLDRIFYIAIMLFLAGYFLLSTWQNDDLFEVILSTVIAIGLYFGCSLLIVKIAIHEAEKEFYYEDNDTL